MSDFFSSLAFTLTQEGGWCNTKGDSGGETYRGISRSNWPTWEGWLIVDHVKAQGYASIRELNQKLAANPDLQNLVVSFYKEKFWSPLYSQINDQAVATKIFDLGVNESAKEITLIVQRACNDCGQVTGVDGKFGSGTLKSINACNQENLLTAIKVRANEFYDKIEVTHPLYKVRFDTGWRARVNA